MRYVFVVNPAAGKGGWQESLKKEIRQTFSEVEAEYEYHETLGPGEAVTFVRNYPKEACFVACGGDGTLNEVITGLAEKEHPMFAVMPFGSGNDFVRMFGNFPAFLSVRALLNGTYHAVDLLECQGRYSVNMCNLGFDADVVRNVGAFRRLPFVSGSMAYILSVVRTLFGKLTRPLTITFDDGENYLMESLLCVMANGQFCGGGFWCAPKSSVNDGFIDFIGVKKVSRLTFAKLVKYYRNGTHLQREEFGKFLIYRRTRAIRLRSKEEFTVCVDGEVLRTKDFSVRVLPGSLSLLLPDAVDFHAAAGDRECVIA